MVGIGPRVEPRTPTPLAPAEYFDRRANRYREDLYEGAVRNHYQLLLRRRRDLLLAMIRELDGPALELGSGPGVLTDALLERGSVVIADISFQMLQAGRAHVRDRASATQLSATHLPFRDGAFKLVTAAGLLEYVPDEPGCLQEIRRVLQGDGVALITFPAPKPAEHLLRRVVRALTAEASRLAGRPADPPSASLRPRLDGEHTLGEARRMLHSAGFRIERVETFHYFYFPWSRLFFAPSRWLNTFLDRVAGAAPLLGHLAQSFVFQVKKQ